MIISRAPLRISFFGGGTDYPECFCDEGGAVLATAIDKYSYIAASAFPSQLFDYSIRLSYRKVELVSERDAIEHAVYRKCLELCGIERDIELHNVADLPSFTGLGSSSAFTVSLLHALHSFKGEFIRPLDLAYEAIHVERDLLHEAVGCQDQVLAAMGGFNAIEFRAQDDIIVSRLPLSPQRRQEFESHLFLVFTSMRRRAAEVAAAQLKRVDVNKPTLRRMRGMVDEGWRILTENGDLSEFGQLLDQAWQEKRSLDGGVTNREIDDMYRRGRDAGAWGGKLLGAGGGGFLLLFAPPERHAGLREAFATYPMLTVGIQAPGSQIIF